MIKSAEGRQHLILRPHGFFDQLLFNADALQSQLPLAGHLTLQGVEGMKQPNRE